MSEHNLDGDENTFQEGAGVYLKSSLIPPKFATT